MYYVTMTTDTGSERRPEVVTLAFSRETEKAFLFNATSSRHGELDGVWAPKSGVLAHGASAIVVSAAWAAEKFRFATKSGKPEQFGFVYPDRHGMEAVQQFVASCLAEGYTPSQAEIDVLARKPAVAPVKKFTGETNRRAWAIRREAAARLGVSLMSVCWGECLRMARAGE